MTYEDSNLCPLATLVKDTLCGTFSGLSKIYRACGLRVGWLSFSGELGHAKRYLDALELLASLRLCSNVPGQWAVQTALGGYQSIHELVQPKGRLLRPAVPSSLHCAAIALPHGAGPRGRDVRLCRGEAEIFPDFDDQQFAMDLLEQKHVLLAPGSSFNVPYHQLFPHYPAAIGGSDARGPERIDDLLRDYETQQRRASGGI